MSIPQPGIGEGLHPLDIVAEPIIAWRGWKIRPERPSRLSPWGIPYVHWVRGKNTATCLPIRPFGLRCDSSPQVYCACGFWGFKSEELLRERLDSKYGSRRHAATPYAWGKIKLWGKIIEGNLGYRGQYAKIEEVVLVGCTEEKRQRIEHTYEVPVVLGEHPFESQLNLSEVVQHERS